MKLKRLISLCIFTVMFFALVSASDFGLDGKIISKYFNGDDGNIYLNTNKVTIQAWTNQNGSFYYTYSQYIPTANWIQMCSHVSRCNKTIPLREGINNLSFKFVNTNFSEGTPHYDSQISESVIFIVDTLKPRITIAPQNTLFISEQDTFNFSFNDIHFDRVRFYSGLNLDDAKNNGSVGIISYCRNGCQVKFKDLINLDAYEGQKIVYWIEVYDKAQNMATTKVYSAIIDKTSPEIVGDGEISTNVVGNRVSFSMEIVDPNFKGVYYYEITNSSNLNKVNWRTMCSSLVNRKCTSNLAFLKGHHNLNIKILDKAGNSLEREVSFDILK